MQVEIIRSQIYKSDGVVGHADETPQFLKKVIAYDIVQKHYRLIII